MKVLLNPLYLSFQYLDCKLQIERWSWWHFIETLENFNGLVKSFLYSKIKSSHRKLIFLYEEKLKFFIGVLIPWSRTVLKSVDKRASLCKWAKMVISLKFVTEVPRINMLIWDQIRRLRLNKNWGYNTNLVAREMVTVSDDSHHLIWTQNIN